MSNFSTTERPLWRRAPFYSGLVCTPAWRINPLVLFNIFTLSKKEHLDQKTYQLIGAPCLSKLILLAYSYEHGPNQFWRHFEPVAKSRLFPGNLSQNPRPSFCIIILQRYR